jgi:hypothetical protein
VPRKTPSRAPQGESRAPRAWLALFIVVASFSMAGCPCVAAVTNASPGLRWWLFSNFGASRVCPEMLKRGVALRLEDRAPAIGRFFPAQCTYNVDDAQQTMTVHFAGTGYGFMSPARRVGFSCTGSVEYRPDFQIAGDDVYVWGKLNRIVQGPNFQLGYVENTIVDVATAWTPLGAVANFFGNQIVSGELTRGFTVVHNEDRGDDFALGLLFPPQKPHHPFQITEDERFTFANETVDIHAQQRDYLGPFEVAEAGQALLMTMSVMGPTVDVMIVDKRVGDPWRESYQTGKTLGPPPGPVLAGGLLQPNVTDTRRYTLPPGLYYVVVDNTSYAGQVAPPTSLLTPLADPVARVSYAAQLAE